MGLTLALSLAGCDTGTPLFDAGAPRDASGGFDAGPPGGDCFDGRQNGDETARDCGGSCPACNLGQSCVEGSDCRSGACINETCAEPSCNDGVQNQDESDIDCGGSCPNCPDESRCVDNDDCSSDSCRGGVCQEATCEDGRMNDRETDVDCGGPICDGCPTGGACSGRNDCLDLRCVDGACAAPTCDDAIENGMETDRDCGGPECRGCRDRQTCAVASDCSSGVCTGGACVGTGDFVDDFESGGFVGEWTTFTPEWTVQSMSPIGGTFSATSGRTMDNGASTLEIRVSCRAAGTVSFDYLVSAASGDRLELAIDGVVPAGATWPGTVSGAASVPIGSGNHTLRWTYRKDFFSASGSDSATIDNIRVTGCFSLL